MKRIYCLLTVHVTSVILSSSVLPYPYKTHKSSRSLTSHQVQVVSCFDVNPDLMRNTLNSALRSNGVLDFQSNVQFFPGKCDDVRFVLHLSELLNVASPKLWIILVNSRANRQLFETVLLSLTKTWNDTVILRTVDTELNSSSDEYSTTSDDMERTSNFVKYFLDSLSWKRIRIFSTNNNAYLTLAKSIELALRRKNFLLKSSVVLVDDLKSTLNSSQPSKFKVLIFCGQLFSAEWYDIVEQAENSKSETVAIISFHFAQNNDISRKLENSSSKILLFVVTWSGVITNSRKNSEENQNQFEDVFSFAGKLIASNYKTGFIRFTDSYEIPGPGSELVPVKLPDDSGAFISLTEASRSLTTARRYRNLELFQWIPTERNFVLIAKSNTNNSYIASASVQWPNGTNSNQNECKEGDQEECDDAGFVTQLGDKTSILSILLGLLGLITLSGVTAFAVRWNFLRRRALKGPHKILFTSGDLIMSQKDLPRPDLIRGSSTSVVTVASHTKRQLSGHMRPRSAIPESTARYNGELVHLRYLADQLSGNFEIKTKAIDVLESLQLLRSENLNPIIGCLCDASKPALLYEHCSRGSLYDVLKRKDVTLDWQFKLSLLTDLVRGMRYLHNSPLQHHGRLTSLNCVIDSRWVLKITDYGLNLFEQAQGLSWKKPALKHLLWTAPELLRDETLLRRGSSAGDIYSFSIIVQEVLTQEEPFAMLAMSTEEIIGKLRKPPPLIRPSVSKGAAPPELINLMRQCWSEAPDSRPSFNEVYDTFKKFNQGKKANIVDSMFEMLEKYSNNLEDLIQERTDQLESERRKTEQLLNRMLPSSVAEKLKLGLPIEPEQFDEVTIYFSDIVGFTTISAYSTPIQIVNLLNDLYTCFDATISSYNVYKVETIGDAYMVVGGLPVRSTDHAEQVATMALDLLSEAGRFEIRHLPGTPLRLRIGIHTGSCCAGVVGLTMPRFCLFGDTVNTASRMESTGAAWRIHLSDTTYVKLEAAGGYQMTYRGLTELKGKGQHPTYWLLNKDGFQKPLPVPPELGESNHGLDKSLIKSIEGDSGTENGGH